MKSLAAILVKQKKPLVIEEIEIPKLTFGQVLVKVICTGICGSQLGEIDGVKGEDRYLPHLLGHEGTGEVLECGEGVTTLKDGDRVALHWRKGSGIESQTPKYQSSKLGKVNGGWITTFNQYAVISENRLTVIPSDFNPEIGALMGCAVTTGLGVINNDAKVKIGESIVVWGAGGIGLNIVQGAAMVSAYPIIAIDLFDNKLDLAKKMGATHTINGKEGNIEKKIFAVVGEDGADIAVDNTGDPGIIGSAYRITSAKGRTILVGVPAKGKETQIYTLPLHFEKVLKGSHGGESSPHIDIPKYVTLYSKGVLKLNPLITKRYNLEQINEAITDMRTGKISGRCMINIQP